MNTEKNIDAGDIQTLSAIKIKEIKLNMMICPADMFANKRIMSEMGLMKIPANSMGARNNFMGAGRPGIQKICFQ